MTTSGSKLNQWAKAPVATWWKQLWRVLALKKVTKSSRITVQERQQSASWRKRTLNSQILWKSQATEAYNPLTITMKPTRKSNDDSLVQYPDKFITPQRWEKANGSFRHQSNCGFSHSCEHECARTTHIGKPIDDSVQKKTTISAIISKFLSPEFLLESNHDEVSGTLTMINKFNNCQVSLSSVVARRELLRFQNGSVVLVNAELSLWFLLNVYLCWLF